MMGPQWLQSSDTDIVAAVAAYARQPKEGPQGRLLPPSLRALEDDAIEIMREVVAECRNPVFLFSGGKDSMVMLHVARKAFYPGAFPFRFLHVATTWDFRDLLVFRDLLAQALRMDLIIHVNEDGLARGIDPVSWPSQHYVQVMSTESLKQALSVHRFDAAFGGARRDEEKSRAKERIFSFRSADHAWEPRNQRPELWRLYNAQTGPGESIRVFPLSNWTEMDVWSYLMAEQIPVVPLYFAAERPVLRRSGKILMRDDERLPLLDGEAVSLESIRFRTLGCYPLTAAVSSQASSIAEIIAELRDSRLSERAGRIVDHDSAGSMEMKKREGYF